MNAFTKKDLIEMWKRPVERQYNIAMTKIFEAIKDTGGTLQFVSLAVRIVLCFLICIVKR